MDVVLILIMVIGGFAVLVCLAIWGLFVWADKSAKKSKIRREENEPIMKQYEDEYKLILEKYRTEREKKIGVCGSGVSIPDISKTAHAALSIDGNLVFYEEDYPKRPEFDVDGNPHAGTNGSCKVLNKISVSSILYWTEKGNLQYTTQSGNGTQVLTNALKGAVIAGTAGAVVGGLGTLGAQNQTVEHDSRIIVVKMKNASEQEFPFSYRKGFLTYVPKKEYEYLKMSKK